jgi:glycosyltransferase involved in cell wall biosynthesis
MIEQPPLREKVRHLGYVSTERLLDAYRAASVLVLPSFEEGFGIPVLEAMTVGVPVIASNRGSLPEILDDAGLLVDPQDEDALVAALARMTDAAFARECAIRGRERSRAFTWSRAAEAARTAYAAALEG